MDTKARSADTGILSRRTMLAIFALYCVELVVIVVSPHFTYQDDLIFGSMAVLVVCFALYRLPSDPSFWLQVRSRFRTHWRRIIAALICLFGTPVVAVEWKQWGVARMPLWSQLLGCVVVGILIVLVKTGPPTLGADRTDPEHRGTEQS
jgi:hypothetical protein